MREANEEDKNNDEHLLVNGSANLFKYLSNGLAYLLDSLNVYTIINDSIVSGDSEQIQIRTNKSSSSLSNNQTNMTLSFDVNNTLTTYNSTLVNIVGDNVSTDHSGKLDLNGSINRLDLDSSIDWNNRINSSIDISMPQMCYSSPEEYEIIPAIMCSSLLVLGVVYIIYGYRCFRAISFITGLIFGILIVYAVLVMENISTTFMPYGNVIITLAIAFALAFLSSLVIFIGLFIIGVNLGSLFGVAVLIVIYLLKPYFEVLEQPLSSQTLLIFFISISLIGCLSTLYFSKGCTLIASSLYGSALTLLCIDYFVEKFRIIHWLFDQMSNHNDDWLGLLNGLPRDETIDCLGTQIILALWPMLTLFGIIIQSTITARGVHYDGYGLITTNNNRRQASFVAAPINYRNGPIITKHGNPEEAQLEQRHKKYRYLYQVRTAHGDVISQKYLQSMQNKKLCLPEQDSFTFNSDLSSHFMPSESRTTTLSVA